MENEITSTEITIANPQIMMRQATDVAGVSREIVMKTAMSIKGRKYVKVEGWQAIAIAHGCVLSARDIQAIEGGISAIGEVRRVSDGAIIATAEGFVGNDEPMWASRPVYARRAMAQTRAMSRAARSAFAHVVVMIDSNLSTTPAEEIPQDDEPAPAKPAPQKTEPPKSDPFFDTVPEDLKIKFRDGKWTGGEVKQIFKISGSWDMVAKCGEFMAWDKASMLKVDQEAAS